MGFMIAMATSYQFGYNISVLNQPSAHIKAFINQSYSSPDSSISDRSLTLLWSFTTTLWVIGGMGGAFSIGFLADKVGRKKSVLLMAIPGIVGGLLCYLSYLVARPSLLMLGRFITGINCGAATQLGPMYMLEVVPYNLKGAMGTLHQLIITLGIFAGSLFGISSLLGTETLWPFVLLANCVPSLVSLLAFSFLPESPRYSMLVSKDKLVSEKNLKWLLGKADVSEEISEMVAESKHDHESKKYTLMSLLRDRNLLAPLMVAVCLQLAQQFSGINAIFFYSSSIYRNAGVPQGNIEFANLGTCAINFIMTLFVIPMMDRAGRRPLLLVPIALMAVSMAVITLALNLQFKYVWLNYVSVTCVICYVTLFAVGLGPIPCMITSELFRQGPRAMACSLAGLANWSANTLVAMSFESIQELTKEYVFVMFFVIMIVSWIFVYFKVPETKNKTFDQIAAQFTKHKTSKIILLP